MKINSKKGKIPVIGIGASAGGLIAFENFFKNMPSGGEAAIVIIQHLDPNHKSILADIVNRYTEMDVSQITDGVKIEPGKVYIIPPNKDVSLKNSELILSPPVKIQGRHLPIDTFFRSLKEDLKEKAIAVILSGTGSDGTHGIRDIKEAGGLTLVQSPETAHYDGMPQSAIKTGLIDFIIPVEKMPEIILKYIDNEFQEKKIIRTGDEKVESYVSQIFHLIAKQTGHDFTGYKQNTTNRRIERRLTVNQVQNLKDYLEFLKTDPIEINMLYKELLISVTNFFRDTSVFSFIENDLIPNLVSNIIGDTVRIWVVACATGEEAYSWAILLKKYMDKNKLNMSIQIFASDIDLDAIAKAREGFYNNNIISDVPQDILNKYFIKEKEGYRVKKTIRELIIFADQNVLQDPPYSRIDLISCRNFLIYLNNHLQQKIIATFHYALNPNGLLVLGNSESLGNLANYFNVVERKHKIFQKLESKNMLNKIWNIAGKYTEVNQSKNKNEDLLLPLNKLAEQTVLERYIPPSVIINYNMDILYVQGKTGKFLELSTGEISHNIIKIAREGLKIALTNTIRKAKINKKETITKNIRVKGSNEYINLTVLPIVAGNKNTDLLMVVFDSYNRLSENLSTKNNANNEFTKVLELEKELAEKEEYLQSTIEELETTNEELKSSNEEAQSANEELQSTNEELETSKEELQSVNEELVTTNSELQNKIEELGKVNSVLNNLLSSTQIATLFLDKEFKIFQYTPAISNIIDLIPSDIGRQIKQFSNNLKYDSLIEDVKNVLETLSPTEKEVKTYDNYFYWMRILPYRTVDDSVEGVVITFTDISEKKKKDEELERYKNELEKLVDEKSRELKEKQKMLVRTEKLANIGSWEWKIDEDQATWSDEVYNIFKRDPQNGTPKYDEIDKIYSKESSTLLKNTVENAIKNSSAFKIELEIIRHDGNVRNCVMIGNPEIDEKGKVVKLAGSLQDITDRKRYENRIKELAEERYKILESINDGFFTLNQDFIVEFFNRAAEKIVNKDRQNVVGKNLFESFPESKNSIFEEKYNYSLTEQKSVSFETYFMPHNIWYKVNTFPYNDKISVIFQDITERKKEEIALKQDEYLFRSIAETSQAGISIVDEYGYNIFTNSAFEKIIGYTPEELNGNRFIAVDPSYLKKFETLISDLISNKQNFLNEEIKMIHKNGGEVWVTIVASRYQNKELKRDNLILMIVQDSTSQKEIEISLQNALAEKEVLLKEIHHRVKNNMQTIIGLLHMQQEHIDNDEAKLILNESIQRVKTMAIVHDDIYHHENLSSINLSNYINVFCNNLLKTHQISPNPIDVQLRIRVDDIFISIDKVIPIALILNELVSNSFKHAFSRNNFNEIIIDCKKTDNEICLVVIDNGIGFDTKVELDKTKSLGLYLVYNIVTKQLKGKIDINLNGKTEFIIKFNLTGKKIVDE
ncbi:MAG: PAS domain S-box protein [Leptospiraceae bacterium]|nr:PAS domain S-box protein [Leptospiraceae bacterium]MCP5495293.1 PAS domain S-box protein [Leptospiraceae bacterium]